MDLQSQFYEEDFLASLFETNKEVDVSAGPLNLNIGNTGLEYNSNCSVCPSPLIGGEAKDRESGFPEEDEGFEDFCEEELPDALQKDSDPSLADSGSIPLENINSTSLDLFFPIDEEMLMGSEASYMTAAPMPQSLEEILELDQGVAMENGHPHLHNCFPDHESVSCDLPFTSPLPSTTSSFDSLCSPQSLTSSYPTHTDSCISHDNHVTDQHNQNMKVKRQNSDLEMIYTMIQSDIGSSSNTQNYQETEQSSKILIDSTSGLDILNSLNLTSSDNNFNTVQQHLEQLNILPTQIPLSGLSGWSPIDFNDSKRTSLTQGQRSPIPGPSIPIPSPVGSVTTDYPDSEFGKDSEISEGNDLGGEEDSKLVLMPFYEFKKILDSPSISERDKEEVKAIRKRGKNKVAAKHCRQRKLEIVMGLQQEVEQLRGLRAQLTMRSLTLQREIEENKARYYRTYHNRGLVKAYNSSTIVH